MKISNETSKWLRSWGLVVFMAGLSGCAGLNIPGETGFFAARDGELQRLDGDREWEMETWGERSNFAPNVSFMVRHPQLNTVPRDKLANTIYLHRVAWVRSEISQEGDILPVVGNQWINAPITDLRVPVRLEPHAESNEVVRVIPETKLEPGLYTLQLQSPSAFINARAGVRWPGVDRRTYAAANCVDRYLGDTVPYRLCADQVQTFASKWLKVHLVEPEIRHISGQQRQLIVKGVVVNTSQRPRKVPVLEAQLLSDQGKVLKRWEFDAATAELQPGASARFESELPNPPPEASNIHVTFTAINTAPGV